MKKITSMILALALIVGILAGCGSTSAPATDEAESENTPTERVFTMAISYMPDTLRPESGNSFKTTMVRPIYESLFLATSEGRRYILAESFDVSEDGLTYTLRMNPNATWSDGYPITVQDVLFTIEYFALNTSVSSIKTVNGEEIAFNVIDDQTLEIVLPEPRATYLNAFYDFQVLPSHVFDNDPTKVDGSEYFTDPESIVTSGPFKVAEFNADSIVYTARSDYFRGQPQVDKVVLKTLGEGASEQIAFENGELSYMRLTTPEDIEKFESQPDKYNVYTMSESRTGYLQLNPLGSTMSQLSEDARKAIFLALDLEEIIEVAYGSERLALPANSLMNPDQVVYDPDCVSYKQDLELAKELAKSSGLEGKTLTYIYAADRVGMEATATVVQRQLAQIGVNLDIRGLDTTTFFSEFFYMYFGGTGDWDLGTNGWGDMRGDRVTEQLMYFTSPSWGFSQEFNDLASQAYTVQGEEETKALWKEIQSKVLEEYWEFPMEYTMDAFVSQKNVTGLDGCTIIPEFADWMEIKVE